MNRIEEIRARLAAIQTEMDAEGADTEALLNEARTLTEEMKTLRAKEDSQRELRGLVAAGAGVVTGSKFQEVNTGDEYLYDESGSGTWYKNPPDPDPET